MRRLAFMVLAALLAWPVVAGAQFSIPPNTTPSTLINPTVTGPLTLNESLGPELLTQTCAGWGLSTPVGASSCSGNTITRTASGSNLTITNVAGVVGNVDKITFSVATLTAGTMAISVGGRACATVSVAGTQTCYLEPGTTGNVTITFVAATAGTIDISATSTKLQQSKIASSAGTIIMAKTLASATENEAAATIVSNQTGAGGDKTTLRLVNIGSGTGAEYLLEGYAGATRNFSVTAGGLITFGGGASSGTLNVNNINNFADNISATPIRLAGGTSTATSGTMLGVKIAPIYNQASGTAANTDLLISRTETALGSGTQKFVSFQAGAAGTTEYFAVSNAGVILAGGGSASTNACWKSDGKTLGYCTGGLVAVCGTCN